MLQQLGPTYVKIGQMAASRSEALPPGWAEELAKLQNTVPPFPYDEARAAIIKELGQPPEELYATFDRGAARSGVAGPGPPGDAARRARRSWSRSSDRTCTTMVRADLGVLQELAARRGEALRDRPAAGPAGVVREFAAGVLVELDYRNEAYHMRRMAGNLSAIAGVSAARRRRRAEARRRVLTMGFVRGRQDQRRRGAGRRGHRPRATRPHVPAGDHQADPHRRVLPRRPTPGQHPRRHRATAPSPSSTWGSSGS